MSTPESQKPANPDPRHDILPTLFGEGQGLYPQRKDTFVYSFILHMVAAGLIIWSGLWVNEHKDEIKQQVVGLVTDISPYIPLPVSKTRAGGGGGGGDRDKLDGPQGRAAQTLQRSDRSARDRGTERESQASRRSVGGGAAANQAAHAG